MSTATEQPSYVYGDRPGGPGLHARLTDRLAETLDPFTRHRLQREVFPGARCWEIGAGTSKVAHSLADWVGEEGHVLATDLDPSGITPYDRLTVARHDIVSDPLPDEGFDLIHTRLLLAHLPNRDEIVHRLQRVVTEGGALVVEQFDPEWDRAVLETPTPEAYSLFAAYQTALMAVLTGAGTDPSWGRRLPRLMRQAGFDAVEAQWWSRSWHGGEAGCMLAHDSSLQLRDRLIEAGMSQQQLDRFVSLLRDPTLVIKGSPLISVIGRRSRSCNHQ